MIVGLSLMIVHCHKQQESVPPQPPVSEEMKLKQAHENVVMNLHVARHVFDMLASSPEKKICNLNQKGWSEVIRKMTNKRKALPPLPKDSMDQIDISLNHFLCNDNCIQDFCKSELE